MLDDSLTQRLGEIESDLPIGLYNWILEVTNHILELQSKLEDLSEKVWYPEGIDE